MIVSCPRCRKQYRLDVSRINYVRMPDNSGLGVQLACSSCHEQWWELKRESGGAAYPGSTGMVPEQPFRNLTDISLLYQRQSGNYSYQAPTDRNGDTGSNRGFSANAGDQMFRSSSFSEKSEPSYKSKAKSVMKIAFWSTMILGSSMAFSFVAMKLGQASKHLSMSAPTEPSINPGEITIEDIQFDTRNIDDKQQQVLVVGKVKNSGPLAIPLRNIQITALGGCSEGQTPNANGVCEIRVWLYKWKQELLQPGEQLTFKSAAKVPANLKVEQVHVDVAAN